METVVGCYAEPHRVYHDEHHLHAVVAGVQALAHHCEDASATILAAFFHDAVYRVGEPGNEDASADLACTLLPDLITDTAQINRVAALVKITADHLVPEGQLSADAAVLCDADLAILGAPAPEYQAYVERVRREYVQVPDDAWQVGRAAVLQHFLDRARIFQTPEMAGQREEAARHNLEGELEALHAR